jgi:hypothetical protein
VGKKSDYPPEYLEAVERYTKPKIVFQSELWGLLRTWRAYVERNLQFEPTLQPTPPYEWDPPSTDDREIVEFFKDLILAAVFYGQTEILQALHEVATLTRAPDPDLGTVRATITAFAVLFKGGDHNDWPNKKQVRERAIEILKQAGSPTPGEREWPRIFKKAGLSKLSTAPRRSKSERRIG